MDTVDYIWMNGKHIPWGEAKIHVLSHTLHYGGGAFEGIRFYETEDGKAAIFRLEEHIERLLFSANTIQMEVPYTKEELVEACLETIRKNNIKSGYIRPIIYFGYGKMGIDPRGAKVETCIAAWGWGSYLGEDMVKVKTSSYVRIHPKSTETQAKLCGHYVNSIMASLEAHNAGFHEALLLDHKGFVAEGPGENIFAVKDGKLITPESGNILVGITRDSIFEIARDNNIEVVEMKMKLEDLKNADEAFFTGTAAEVTPINQIDDSVIGDGKIGPVTEQLKSIYTKAIHGALDQYIKWLTYA
ncbi:branched-chain amino acid transaminase [Patescibacteria group bacterium]